MTYHWGLLYSYYSSLMFPAPLHISTSCSFPIFVIHRAVQLEQFVTQTGIKVGPVEITSILSFSVPIPRLLRNLNLPLHQQLFVRLVIAYTYSLLIYALPMHHMVRWEAYKNNRRIPCFSFSLFSLHFWLLLSLHSFS